MTTAWAALAGLLASPLVIAAIRATSRRPSPRGRWWPAVIVAACALAGGWAGYWTPSPWVAAAWALLLITGVGLAVLDLREHRLPTPMIAAAGLGAAAALTAAAAADGDWSRWWLAAASAAAAFVLFFGWAMVTGMGYGDVRLAALIAGVAGFTSPAAAAAALLGGLLTAGVAGVLLLAAGRPGSAPMAMGPWLLLGAAASLAVLPGVH